MTGSRKRLTVQYAKGAAGERRILYVISRYTYRSTFIVREIAELADRGWTITVVSLRRPILATTSPADLRYVVLYDSFMSARVLIAVAKALAAAPRAIAAYVRLVASAFRGDMRSIARNLVVIPKACFYATLVRDTNCQHIHAHWATVSTSTAMLMSQLSQVPFSFTGHAWDIFCDTRLLAEKGDAARFVLTCTAYNRQHLVEKAKMDPGKIHVLYHGLRLPAEVSAQAAASANALRLLTIGRWSEKKGFLELIEALALVRKEGVDFNLQIIAGDGSATYEQHVRAAISRHGLDQHVKIRSWLPSDEVETTMRASDLFVLPCVNPTNGAMDGIPNVLIEALSVELPVVTTRLSGIPELVRHRETGLLVNERDPHDLASAIVWCTTHMPEMRRLAAQGRRLVESQFDIRQTISTLERHFSSVIAGGPLSG